jgi:hypothetical protein
VRVMRRGTSIPGAGHLQARRPEHITKPLDPRRCDDVYHRNSRKGVEPESWIPKKVDILMMPKEF